MGGQRSSIGDPYGILTDGIHGCLIAGVSPEAERRAARKD